MRSEGRLLFPRTANHYSRPNAWEWMLDWYARDYDAVSTVVENPLGPTHGAVKAIRGGSFNADGWQARVTNRAYANRDTGRAELGFRVVIGS